MSVQARTVDVQTSAEWHTNDFKFTWGEPQSEMHLENGTEYLANRIVVPKTYEGGLRSEFLTKSETLRSFIEAMAWIEGRRALEYGAQIRGLVGS